MSFCPTGSSSYRNCVANFLDNNPTNANPDDSGIVLDINNEFGASGPTPSLTQRFTGRWELITGTVGVSLNAGTYTFITVSDDGVRLRYDTYPTPGNLPPPTADDPPNLLPDGLEHHQ